MAQLLGVLGLNNEETKLHMAKEGVVMCLVDILVGGGNYCNRSPTQTNNEEKLGLIALAQEAAVAALATIILHCKANAEAAVQAGAISHLVKLLGPITANCDKTINLNTEDLLPSTYKSMRDEINFPLDTTTASNSNYKLDLECNDSKMHTANLDENLVEVGSHTGRSLVAMAALGNMVSCYPQCWREIVDAGALPRLANLLKGVVWMNGGEQNNKVSQPQECRTLPTKVQESAALVLDLLIDCEKNNCST